MPRPKKASARGNFQPFRRGGGRKAFDTSFVPFSGTSTPRKGHGLTLQEEAHQTERHRSFWNTDQRLRDSRVNFISAGSIVPTEPHDAEAALAEMTLESPKPGDRDVTEDAEQELDYNEDAEEEATPEELAYSIEAPLDAEVFGFIVDTHGSGPVQTGIPSPELRPASPTPSNSSEEVILFRGRGRGNNQPATSAHLQRGRKIPENIDERIRIVEDKIHEQTELLQDVIGETHSHVPLATPKRAGDANFESLFPRESRGRGRRGGRWGKNIATEMLEEDAILADYIANMAADDSVSKSFNQRDLGGEAETWQDTEASPGEAAVESTGADSGGWNRPDIDDIDDLCTSDGVMGEVQAILSKRERVSGIQYLVVWENLSDEARWVPATTLTSAVALALIETFEAEKLVAEFQDNENDTSDSDAALDVDTEDDKDDEDDADLLQKKIDGMTDERIARLLAKQEELGMGSDEILIFDEDEDEDQANDGGFMRPSDKVSGSKFAPAKSSRGSQPAKAAFPSVTPLADAYDGFDVMDFARPSLKKRPKGRKGKLILDGISDSELKASIQAAWENDREKKKERKKDREELRVQGLLGSKSGKVEVRQRYKEGMGVYAVREEIKNFLIGGSTTLSLPPMNKDDRRFVHQLAQAFNLRSKSAGSGDNRFPILHRTSRTLAFNDGAFAKVDARIARRFLPRTDVGGKRGGGFKHAAGGAGGFNRAAVGYRDGDIVGGSAPELAADNRGRAMLEKMGWSSGTALGALNNKGIMLPVSHIVKTTKAGLG